MRKRFLNMTIALGLVIGLMAGVVGSASADTSPAGTNSQWIYFPWVPNGEMMDGAGPWYGTVTIQNVEQYRVVINISDTAGGIGSNTYTTTLEPGASKTISAAQLGIASPGSAVSVQSSWAIDPNTGMPFPADNFSVNNPFNTCSPHWTSTTVTRSSNPVDPIGGTVLQGSESYVYITYVDANGVTQTVPAADYTVQNDKNILWNVAFFPTGATYKVHFIDSVGNCRAPIIAGVEKHVMSTPSFSGKTNATHMSVDGYSAIPQQDVAWGPGSTICQTINGTDCVNFGDYTVGIPDFFTFDGQSYLPIAQTNSGWDTVIHTAVVDPSAPDFTAVTLTFYTAGSQGAFGPSVGSFTTLLSQGDTWTFDLSKDGNIPDGWVGDVWITSDYGVVAVANRQKPSTGMAITNQSAPSLLATTSPSVGGGAVPTSSPSGMYTMVAPLVLKNYNGWNMGFNVANISEFTNNVQIQLIGPTGDVVGGDSLTIPAKAMEYWYVPATQDLGLDSGFVGAAILSSYLPFHAAVDEVKYTGQGQDVGQAMSYIATDAGASAEWCSHADPSSNYCEALNQYDILTPTGNGPELAIPLIQKGDPNTGMGDISGINLFNASPDQPSTVHIWFQMESGAAAAPTLSAPYELQISGHGTATVYTMDSTFSEMSQNFQGSALIYPVEGAGAVFAVSNNVNYAVKYDGSAVYNAINTWGQFRMLCSQQGIVDNNGNFYQNGSFSPCLSLQGNGG